MVVTTSGMIELLQRARRVLVTTHVRPDGDALGSTAAMCLGLAHKGITAEALLLSKLPSKYSFVYNDAGIAYRDVDQGFPADFSLDAYDTLLVIDTGTWSQLPGLRGYVDAFKGTKLVIDHHVTQEDWADAKLVITHAGAAAEIVGELLDTWGVPLDARIGQPLYVGMVSDTGWFQYSSTRPYTLRLAARLLEAGVDADRLYQLLYQNERPQRLAMQARAMQSLELLQDERLAVMSVSQKDFADTGAGVNDSEGLINIPLQVSRVQVSVLLSHPPEGGAIRISFRSKGSVDVAAFAQQFGGGGHVRAAGAKIEGELLSVRTRVVNALSEVLARAAHAE